MAGGELLVTGGSSQLLHRLGPGDDPLSTALKLIRERHGDLLQRATVPRHLDRKVLVAMGGAAEDLDTLARLGLAEPLPRHPGTFRVHDVVRGHREARWPAAADAEEQEPEALQSLRRRLIEHYEAHGDLAEALYHRFRVDPSSAVERFEELFAAADAAFALTRCRDLLGMFGDWLDEAHPPRTVRASHAEAWGLLWREYQAYVDARGAWLDDWYRSARFLQPAETVEPIEDLLAGRHGGVLQVWGRGGLGKTMLLRWLIARRCIPKPDPIPCARVDFDGIEVITAIEQPWLVLLEIAAQLDPQLRERPFLELLRDHGAHRVRLWPPTHVASLESAARPPSNAHDETTRADVEQRFAAALAELDASRERVVVMLDTTEEPLLAAERGGGSQRLDLLLSTLATVHRQAPAMRLLFSGRYDFRRRVPGFSHLFPQAKTLPLSGFRPEEARRYLTEQRSIADERLVAAGVAAGGSMPLKLALIGDVIEQGGRVTPEIVLAHRDDHDLLYLIKRVLERVEHPVEWILRYSVVPRTLDRDVFIDVLLPAILAGMSGYPYHDNPADDELPGRTSYRKGQWEAHDHPHRSDDELWNALNRYAGRASWVEVDHREVDTVRVHAEVRNPMRRLLAQRPVWAELQDDARRYFEGRAAREPEHAERWLREAVYHAFQGNGAKAAMYWRGQLKKLTGIEHAEARRQIAADLLGRDYTDDDGKPARWVHRGPLIKPETLLEARFEVALATAQAAWQLRLPRSAPAWSEAEQHMGEVELAAGTPSAPDIVPARKAMVRALLLLADGQPAAASPAVATVLDANLSAEDRWWLDEQRLEEQRQLSGQRHPVEERQADEQRRRAEQRQRDEQLWLAVEHAEALRRAHERTAEEHFRAVLARVPEDHTGRIWRQRIRAGVARVAIDRNAPDVALRELGEEGEADTDGLHLLRAELLVETGRARQAESLLSTIPDSRVRASAPFLLLQARALLAQWRPADALVVLSRAEHGASTDAAAAAARQWRAEIADLRARAHADLLDVDRASRAFAEAIELWRQADERSGLCRAHVRRAAFQLRTLGHVVAAGSELASAGDCQPAPMSHEWAELVALEAEHKLRLGNPGPARQHVDQALDQLLSCEAAPRSFITVALAGLALGGPDSQDHYLRVVCGQLRRVSPNTDRLWLLSPLTRCPSLVHVRNERRVELRRCVPSPFDRHRWRRAEPSELPEAPLGLIDVELDRVTCDTSRAAQSLELLQAHMCERGLAPVLERWLQALVRVQHARPRPPRVRVRIKPDGADSPLMNAAVLIRAAQAELAGLAMTTQPAAELLDAASTALERQGRGSEAWQALLQETRAELLRASGTPMAASDHALLAAGIYDMLGDARGYARALDRIHDRPSVRPRDKRDDELVLFVDVAPAQIVATLRRPTGATHPVPTPTSAEQLVRSLQDPSAAPERFAQVLFRNGWQLEAALRGAGSGRRDVRLVTTARSRRIPWELAVIGQRERSGGLRLRRRTTLGHLYRGTESAALDADDVRALQLALRETGLRNLIVDGILGEATRATLQRFQRTHGLTATRIPDPVTEQLLLARLTRPAVTIVQSDHDADPRASRSVWQRSIPLDWLYERNGMEVRTASLLELERELHATPTPVVHICLGLVEVDGAAALDPRGDWASTVTPEAEPEQLGAVLLDEALRGIVPKPIVILDPPAPRHHDELLRQLLLRNELASELYELGSTLAVFATGLTSFEQQAHLSTLLVEALAAGSSLGDVVEAARRIAEQDPWNEETLLAFGAIALSARSAHVRPPWRR